ncbi:hypothetical protein GALL_293490 [mine drainage metagenome]|uniref:Uncharacterized protein n=1 Tax=mine drainage metagenome TaxID=410659 RepID=A0A1J5QYR0_9ZZZZ
MRPVVRINGNLRLVRSSVATNGVSTKCPFPRTNPSACMVGVPSGAESLHGHCRLPTLSSLANETPEKVGVVAAISSMIWLPSS